MTLGKSRCHVCCMALYLFDTGKKAAGFSLAELLVAVLITSLLATVGLTVMRNPLKKAIISECQQHVGSLLKAAQVYHFENGEHATRISQIEQEIYVPACKKPTPEYCRENPPDKASSAMSDNQSNFNAHWNSPNGHCMMQHRGGHGTLTQFWARPSTNTSLEDFTISGCWNSQTGVSRIDVHSYEMTSYAMRNNDDC